MITRRKFASKFKLKKVLEALKEQSTFVELAQKYEITPQKVSTWKRKFLYGADIFFGSEPKEKKSEVELKKENLLKIIDELKVANDFLIKALR